jgi:cysteine desulfurase
MDQQGRRTRPGRSYFDAAAGAPLHPVARQALLAALEEGWADPSKLYTEGRRAAHLLEAARATVADLIDARPDEVTFCTGAGRATELAIEGARLGRGRIGDVVVHSSVEHSSVIRAARRGTAIPVPVRMSGRIDEDAFAAAVAGPRVALAAVQAANHETGTVQPILALARLSAQYEVPMHVDAAASLGHVAAPQGWSTLSASASKWGGPAGVGILGVRRGIRWTRPWPVERREPDVVSLPLIVAAAASLRAVMETMEEDDARLRDLVDWIRSRVASDVPDVEIVGDPDSRLPHIVTFSCLYVDGEALLHELDRHGFAVSSGSSCTAATLTPSHVLEAMGVLSHGNVRVSLHRGVTEREVERFLAVLPRVVARLRGEAGAIGL